MTGEQAEKAMGFRPREGAVGVVLSRRRYVDNNGKVRSGIFATSLMPRKMIVTEKLSISWERQRVLGKIVSKHMKDIIFPIWEPLVKNKSKKPWCGNLYFMSTNLLNMGKTLAWDKLQISKGRLAPPSCAYPYWYDKEKKELHIVLPQTIKNLPITVNQIGIGVFDIITGEIFHILPEQISQHFIEQIRVQGINPISPRDWRKVVVREPLKLKWAPEQIRKYYTRWERSIKEYYYSYSRFFIYNYYKKGSEYSPSISSKSRTPKYKNRRERGIHIIISLIDSKPLTEYFNKHIRESEYQESPFPLV